MSTQTRLQAVDDSWVGEPDAPPTPPNPGTDSAAGGTNPPGGNVGGSAGRLQKQRSDRSLPTDRLSFDKQVDVLRAIAQLSGPSKKSVTAEDASAAIGLKGNTAGLCNKFFRDTGWVVSTGRGTYAATEPLLEYHRHLNIDAQDFEGARRYLVTPAQGSWYWVALEPILDGGARKPMVLLTLSKAAGAHDHTPQLEMIVTWLEWLGLVRREGDVIFPTATEGSPSADAGNGLGEDASEPVADTPATEDGSLSEPETLAHEVQSAERDGALATPLSSTTLLDGPDASALVSFSFSVRITAEDAAKLSAEQLQSVLDFAEKLRG
jgi:hypothetical protein